MSIAVPSVRGKRGWMQWLAHPYVQQYWSACEVSEQRVSCDGWRLASARHLRLCLQSLPL